MKYVTVLLTLLFLTGCQHFKTVPSKWTGKEAYTKHGFHYEKNRHIATNYIRGFYVSPNTKVKVMNVKGNSADLMIDGNLVSIVNTEKYTNLNIEPAS